MAARFAIALLLLLGQAVPSSAESAAAAAAAAGAVDPEAFAATTPMPRKNVEGVFAGFVLQMVVGGVAEEYQGGMRLEREVTTEEKKQIVDYIFNLAGEYYTEEAEDMGLPAPANASAIPGRNEIVHPGYFAAYTYAAFRAGWDILGDAGTFRRFEDRIGGRVFDAVSQYANFVPSHDMDDIKGMRKNLREFLKKYAALGLAADAGALFPKGMDKDWAAGDSVTFKIWVDTPTLQDTTARLQAQTGEFKDWLFYIVQRFFTSYLVDAELTAEYPSEKQAGLVTQEWTIEPM